MQNSTVECNESQSTTSKRNPVTQTLSGVSSNDHPPFDEHYCPSCGARFVTARNEEGHICPWCGEHLRHSGSARKSEVPSFFVPFSVSREKAVVSLQKYTQDTWFTPEEFEVQINRMQATYIPYWLFDVKAWETLSLLDRTHGAGTCFFWGVRQSARATYSNLPVSASQHVPQYYMEAAGLFWLEKRCSPTDALTEGIIAELPDKTAGETVDQGTALARDLLHDWLLCKSTRMTSEHVQIGNYKGFSNEQIAIDMGVEIVERKDETRIADHRLCALPLWILHCTYESKDVLFVVNGQTGTCAGNLLIDEPKVVRSALPGFVFRVIIATTATTVLLAVCFLFGAQLVRKMNGATGIFGLIALNYFIWKWAHNATPGNDRTLRHSSVKAMAEGSRVLRPTREESIIASWKSKYATSPKLARRYLSEKLGTPL